MREEPLVHRTHPFDGDLHPRVRPLLRKPGGVLLDSNGPVTGFARWRVAAGPPRTVYRSVGDRLVRHPRDGDPEVLDGDPLAALERVLPDPGPPPGDLPFAGGAIGYVGFEAVRFIEDVPVHDAPLPDLWVGIYDRAVVQDRREDELHLIARGDDADVVGLQRLLKTQDEPGPIRSTDLASTHDRDAYVDAVRRVQKQVRAGDVFQVNIAQRLEGPAPGDPVDVYGRLRRVNPGPFNAFLNLGDAQIASSSPERLVQVQGDWIQARPIAGTRPRSMDADEDARLAKELRTDGKEAAEHAMIVDLYRNDVARLAKPGTVRVDPYRSLERYARVMHLTSNVVAKARGQVGPVDAVRALFPGGSITGAPKVRATEIVHEVEPGPRGPYTGSLGILTPDHTDLNILIRTLVFRDGRVSLSAGGGVVHGSDPAAEHDESQAKARALVEALTDPPTDRPATGYEPGEAWRPRPFPASFPDARVLVVDNYDSFVHNLADHLRALDARVRVVRHDALTVEEARGWDPTHVVLSPGPKGPKDTGVCPKLVEALDGEVPVLGVCLGHQVLADVHGGTVEPAPQVVHGKASPIRHDGAGILRGVPSPLAGGRYHSLHVPAAPEGFEAIAWTGDLLMGMAARDRPTTGLAFHPESLLTDHGMRILASFLGQSATER